MIILSIKLHVQISVKVKKILWMGFRDPLNLRGRVGCRAGVWWEGLLKKGMEKKMMRDGETEGEMGGTNGR